MMIPDFLLI